MTMVIKNKHTGEVITLREGAYEVGDAFIMPLQCFYKEDYELVVQDMIKEKNNG